MMVVDLVMLVLQFQVLEAEAPLEAVSAPALVVGVVVEGAECSNLQCWQRRGVSSAFQILLPPLQVSFQGPLPVQPERRSSVSQKEKSLLLFVCWSTKRELMRSMATGEKCGGKLSARCKMSWNV